MKQNVYPVARQDFLKIMKVGNYPIMYAVLADHIHIEMPIENCIFVAKKFLVSLKEEMQIGVDNDPIAQLRYFLRHYLKSKNAYQFYPSETDKKAIRNMKMYSKLIVREAAQDEEYDPELIIMKEDDINIYLYQLDKLIYRLEKS